MIQVGAATMDEHDRDGQMITMRTGVVTMGITEVAAVVAMESDTMTTWLAAIAMRSIYEHCCTHDDRSRRRRTFYVAICENWLQVVKTKNNVDYYDEVQPGEINRNCPPDPHKVPPRPSQKHVYFGESFFEAEVGGMK